MSNELTGRAKATSEPLLSPAVYRHPMELQVILFAGSYRISELPFGKKKVS